MSEEEIKKQLKYLKNWLDEHHKYKTIGNLDSRFSFDLDDLQNFYDYIINLQNQLRQKENIIKEVREYIENNKQYVELEDYGKNGDYYIDEIGLLEILDKENKSV